MIIITLHITRALGYTRSIAIDEEVKKIAMPKIGSGLELQWNKVSEIIQEVFKDTDIEILVCVI